MAPMEMTWDVPALSCAAALIAASATVVSNPSLDVGGTITIEDGQFLCTGAARIHTRIQLRDRMLQAEVGSRDTTNVQGVDGVPLLLQLLRFPSQTVHRLGVVAPLSVITRARYRPNDPGAIHLVADCIGIIACVLDQRDLHLFGGVIDTLILILDLAQEAGDRLFQRLQPRGARPTSDGFNHTAGHIQHKRDVERDHLLLSGFAGLARHIHAQGVGSVIVLRDALGMLWGVHVLNGSGRALRLSGGIWFPLIGCVFAIGGHAGSGKADGHGHGHGQRDKPALESAGLGAGLLRVLLGIESSGSSHHSPICGSSQVSV